MARGESNPAEIISSSRYLAFIYRRVYLDMFLSTRIEVTDTGLELGAGNVSYGTEFFPNLHLSQGHVEVGGSHQSIQAEALPFDDNSLDYVISKDALHHFRDPIQALSEISRVLKADGVFIVAEPYWSLLGRLIFKYFHPEDWEPQAKDLRIKSNDPWESNQALLYILSRQSDEDSVLGSGLQLRLGVNSYGISYALSGGVFSRNRIPDGFLIWLNSLERKFPKVNRIFFGLSVVGIFKKSAITNSKVPKVSL